MCALCDADQALWYIVRPEFVTHEASNYKPVYRL